MAQFVGLRAVFAVMAVVMLALPIVMTLVTDDGMDATERDAYNHDGRRATALE